MKRIALILTSGTLALGVTFTSFWFASLVLTTIGMQHRLYNVTWLK